MKFSIGLCGLYTSESLEKKYAKVKFPFSSVLTIKDHAQMHVVHVVYSHCCGQAINITWDDRE